MKDKITVDGIEYVRADAQQAAAVDGLRYYIIRCRDAGVHAGFLKDRTGREVTLVYSRRLWRWHGKTLSGLCQEGTTDASKCKYADEIPDEVILLDACEILPCTQRGMDSIRKEIGPWVNE